MLSAEDLEKVLEYYPNDNTLKYCNQMLELWNICKSLCPAGLRLADIPILLLKKNVLTEDEAADLAQWRCRYQAHKFAN